jgi:hypothetical protein
MTTRIQNFIPPTLGESPSCRKSYPEVLGFQEKETREIRIMNLLSTKEAAAFLHKPAGTLRYWRSIGFGPRYKLGKTVLYDEAELVDFVRSNTIVPSVRTEARKEANRVAL